MNAFKKLKGKSGYMLYHYLAEYSLQWQNQEWLHLVTHLLTLNTVKTSAICTILAYMKPVHNWLGRGCNSTSNQNIKNKQKYWQLFIQGKKMKKGEENKEKCICRVWCNNYNPLSTCTDKSKLLAFSKFIFTKVKNNNMEHNFFSPLFILSIIIMTENEKQNK